MSISMQKALLTALLLASSTRLVAQLDSTEQAMVAHVDATNDAAMALMIQTININSGTMNFEGVRDVGAILGAEFDKLGFTSRWVDGAAFNRAGHLVAELHNETTGPKLLLIGHLDTVFEPDSPFQTYTHLDDNTATGPGIADMKGGNVIILQALSALKQVGMLDSMDITVVMTGDEELSGSPRELSKQALIDAADYADIAIGFENGDGDPTTANISRRGSSGWTLNVTGKPSHSSQIFREDIGPGAIFETARILMFFYQDLQQEENLTFNPGRIIGGTTISMDGEESAGTAFGKNNVVAETAMVTGDMRAVSLEQLERARSRMREIVADNFTHTSATITFTDGYPPLAPTAGNERLLGIYSKASQDLGLGVVTAVNPRLAGAADVSFTAGRVDMAIDGLGMSGTAGHTVDETGFLDALPNQAKRAAVLMYRLYRDQSAD
jgi:glutamate carboxypeptidase